MPIINNNFSELGLYFENELADIYFHALHEGYMKGTKLGGTEFITNSEVIKICYEENHWIIETTSE